MPLPPALDISPCVTDADYEAWRSVRIAVVPYELCPSVEDLRRQDEKETRLMLLARADGVLVGSGLADRSDSAATGSLAPRVLPDHRRRGTGTALLRRLAAHLEDLGLPRVRATVDDDGSLAFAHASGFEDIDHEIEQTFSVTASPHVQDAPEHVEVVLAADRPGLWEASYERFGREATSDFALSTALDVTPERWATSWLGDPMFLAVHDGRVVGCAGLVTEADVPHRAENALTAVRRDWRGRGLAIHLKQRTLAWAAEHGITEVYTWTQDGNHAMRTLNERLGYATTRRSTMVARDLPLD
ncbi:GNAT family N-acetyltransferase [Nocardioides hwasunensis]|uniref:GNAT family N-acetyltransferase n=1 Tax=Nocardioides hwasunensis TaxID=397258 RepID=A0ABR8MIM2_9ACTN|nr:GNAT family N-acetyltransferase [Nocardioides hwasunensis]MBD3914901.1 GNAT family N-acetyltransferase [Nocardioides hwasunensis]